MWVIPPREYRFNERIRVPEVRVVDDEGEQLGVMTVQNALEIAGDKGLDLVEVAPQAAPPVCRIMDYGKFRYEATRKEREARKARKSKAIQELREVRMKTRIGQHDLSSKTRLVKRLLGQGAKVKVSVMFRGRENFGAVVQTGGLIKPTSLVGDYEHLGWKPFAYEPNHTFHDFTCDFEKYSEA